MTGSSDNDGPPPPPEDWLTRQPWLEDPLAFGENENFTDESKLRQTWIAARTTAAKQAGYIAVVAMWVIFILAVVAILIWTIHFLAPTHFLWLNEAQLSKLQSVIFSGSVGALVTGLLQKFISDK